MKDMAQDRPEPDEDTQIMADSAVQKALHTLKQALSQAGQDRGVGDTTAMLVVARSRGGVVSSVSAGCDCPYCTLDVISALVEMLAESHSDRKARATSPHARAH